MKRIAFAFTLALPIAASAQTWVVDSLLHQGDYRYYGAYLPATYDGSDPWPVVLTLHGGGGNALGTVGFTQMNNVADTADFIVVYPQGTEVDGNCCSWAAGVGSPADTLGIDDVAFFNSLIDTLNAILNVDTMRIYATGLSQGGYMSHRLACELSGRLAAVAPLCSKLDSLQMLTCAPTRPVPVMMINGTDDLLVPYAAATFTNNGWPLTYFSTDSVARFWAALNSCSLSPDSMELPDLVTTENSTITLFDFPACSCGVETRLYRVNGGGHTWPGVVSPLYELIAGETNEDIHASAEIWDFFRHHSLDCVIGTSVEGRSADQPVVVAPNPFVSSFTILLQDGLMPSSVELFDATGRLVLHQASAIPRIEAGHLDVGHYLLRVVTPNGQVMHTRLVKE